MTLDDLIKELQHLLDNYDNLLLATKYTTKKDKDAIKTVIGIYEELNYKRR